MQFLPTGRYVPDDPLWVTVERLRPRSRRPDRSERATTLKLPRAHGPVQPGSDDGSRRSLRRAFAPGIAPARRQTIVGGRAQPGGQVG
ncbi:conserved hypothetical protein [Actinomyces sp. oral taxon 180 str. F0310]|nr:conserved hypothetical protein [Actinomyces sp. oral taxon 180 str. F0310]